MKQDNIATKDDKEKLKALREERKEILDRNKERLKKQNQEITLIRKDLKKGPRTIPAIAAATGLATHASFAVNPMNTVDLTGASYQDLTSAVIKIFGIG